MTDASEHIPPTSSAMAPATKRESWTAMFGIGAAVGMGIVIAFHGLQSVPSLTERLRVERADGGPAARVRVSVAQLPSDLNPVPLSPDNGTVQDGGTDATVARVDGITVAALESDFASVEYRLRDIRERVAEVPRIVPNTVPRDIEALVDIDRRKTVFFKMVLPLVLMVNEDLMATRARIEELTATGVSVSPEDAAWLAGRYESYRVEPGDVAALLRRVDAIPPSLALAQAAIESGWGTSRFAQEGNALFGQWVWGEDADGIVPEERKDGMTHKIRAFETPLQAVAAYIKNLNTHRAYGHLRDIRARLRRQGAPLNGMTLAEGLEAYSEKGREYIRIVRQVISANRLRPLDGARLRDARA